MNGYTKIITSALALASFIGALVWNASTMGSDIETNKANIEDVERTQDAVESDLRDIRRELSEIKTQTSIILERVGGRGER